MGCLQSMPESQATVQPDRSERHHQSMPESQATVQPGRSERHHQSMSKPQDTVQQDRPERHHQSMSKPQDTVQQDRPERHRQSMSKSHVTVQPDRSERHDRRADTNDNLLQQRRHKGAVTTLEEEMYNAFINGDNNVEMILKGIPLESIVNKYRQAPTVKDMTEIQDRTSVLMIKPFKFDPSRPNHEPRPFNDGADYVDRWDENHVRMPCSQMYTTRNREPMWPSICHWLKDLKKKCDNRSATFNDLRKTIENISECQNDMGSLEKLIQTMYSDDERTYFMSTTLSKMCELVLTANLICSQPPPLLRIGSNKSVTMSQRQAASLLACAFFCLFPYRSDQTRSKEYEKYPNPNFDRLYQRGSTEKIEKLKCILHYFQRVTEKMPTGIITIQRFALSSSDFPNWPESKKGLCDLHMTTGKKIEDINNVLQVDFANKFIGGGVLGNGCVQEEIRFSICPEMLVSLLVCEVMEPNECVFLIGCERYATYKGYADSFKFAGDYTDYTSKDIWGRKWCHLVAMDAIFFRDKSIQFQIKNVERELLKAYTSFRPLGHGPDYEFGIATGNWGCGAFNGDRQLKAIIQLMAASEARRPLIYAAFGDKNLVNSFADIYKYLKEQEATVGDLYWYLLQYSHEHNQIPLFEYILSKPLSSQKSKL